MIDTESLRTVPDARDGLRPVERRVLSVRHERGLLPGTPYRRSAKIIGEVRQRFPGQGWRSAYNALVRMAQDFVLRYPLIDGEGNFGSIEGDPAADANYTEARLTPLQTSAMSPTVRRCASRSRSIPASIRNR